MSDSLILGLAGILAAGVVGPGVGYWAASRSDRRRFEHERGLKASDDVLARVDDVAASLRSLSEACSVLNAYVTIHGAGEEVRPPHSAARVALRAAEAEIARLAIRPRVPRDTVAKAEAASSCFSRGLDVVTMAMSATTASESSAGPDSPALRKVVAAALGALPDYGGMVTRGDALISEFEDSARAAMAPLLGSEEHATARRSIPRPNPT
jgi:hypothetical protein